MSSNFVAFLRGVSNVPMRPLRDAFVEAGLSDVRSFGGTGNMLFRAGMEVYFVHPLRWPGRKSIVYFERELGVPGTMRASRV